MKNLALLALVSVLQVSPAFALVRMVEACHTSNGEYSISIIDNQGIGPVRKSHYVATVSDSTGNPIASYNVNPPPAVQSASFGRSPYTDVLTQGHQFSLAFPSTNFNHTSVLFAIQNGNVYRSDDVVCNHLL